MSQLAKCLRKFLEGSSGYSTQFPGGITPDNFPKGVLGSKLTFGMTQGVSRVPIAGLLGVPVHYKETIRLSIIGKTREIARAARDWVSNLIGQSRINLVIGSVTVVQWGVDDDGSEDNENRQDGSDEDLRTVDIEITGII